MTILHTLIIIYLATVNVVAFLLFGFDKWMARGGGWRISEKILWLVALVGGSVGALAGMNFFRHKTRKASFQFVLACIVLLHVGIVAALYWLYPLEV